MSMKDDLVATNRLMKCADIDDYAILVAIESRHYHGKVGMTLFDLAGVMWENADYGTGLIGGQDYEKLKVLPINLVKAKMRRLIKRGLVHGCACGCRGDFTLTVKGKKEISNIQ